MCIICIELEKKNLSPWEAERNLSEMVEKIGEKHAEEVKNKISEAAVEEKSLKFAEALDKIKKNYNYYTPN